MTKKDFKNLHERIKSLKPDKVNPSPTPKPAYQAISSLLIATELVAGSTVGIIIGVFLDKMFDSKPIFFIVCLLIGLLASIKIIWQKVVNKKQ